MRPSIKHQNDLFKIGELAEALGTTPRTIRLYEELGLISPERTEGGTRLYAKKDLKRMAIALQLGRIGIELETIQKLAHMREQYATGKEASAAVLTLMEDFSARIRSMKQDLETLEKDLERADILIRQCENCQNRPNRKDCPNCPVDKNVDLTNIARLIWDPNSP